MALAGTSGRAPTEDAVMPCFVPRLLLLSACLTGLAGPARAELPGGVGVEARALEEGPAPLYPLAVRLRLGDAVRTLSLQHRQGSGLAAPGG